VNIWLKPPYQPEFQTTLAGAKLKVAFGEINPVDTWAFYEGLADWVPLSTLLNDQDNTTNDKADQSIVATSKEATCQTIPTKEKKDNNISGWSIFFWLSVLGLNFGIYLISSYYPFLKFFFWLEAFFLGVCIVAKVLTFLDSRCPKCRKWGAKETISELKVSEATKWKTETREKYVTYDQNWNVISRTDENVDVSYKVDVIKYSYKCCYCSYNWEELADMEQD